MRSGPEILRIEVPKEASGKRLDAWLSEALGVARNQVQRWIEGKQVTIPGSSQTPRGSHRVRPGEVVRVERWPPKDDRILPEPGALEILLEDEQVLAVNKPAGLVVHPGSGRPTGTLVHRLLAAYPELEGVGGPGRPGVVHRLDKDTSGVLLVARSHKAYWNLIRQFASREVEKRYLAFVHGVPRQMHGTIVAPIGRHPHHRKRMAVRADGKEALTEWKLIATAKDFAAIEARPITGRTHQIRVHLKHLGHPIVGDSTYGPRSGSARHRLFRTPRTALHAWRLCFRHPISEVPLTVIAPLPRDLEEAWVSWTGHPLRLRETDPAVDKSG